MGGRRAAVPEAARRQVARRPIEKAPSPHAEAPVCAGCAGEIEGGPLLRNGLLYCSFECAAYAPTRVPGLYLG